MKTLRNAVDVPKRLPEFDKLGLSTHLWTALGAMSLVVIEPLHRFVSLLESDLMIVSHMVRHITQIIRL